MNYYEHHLGDWAAATGHLSWDEDMAYTRLLRAYYHAEKPIPDGQQYRLAKAMTPAQRRAVDAVLAEFFELVDGTYRQKRADEEIARFLDKQRKAKASANARWSQSDRNANASPNAMRTHSEGNALQTPDTRHQEEDEARIERDACADVGDAKPTAAGLACRAMRLAGLLAVNPGDPRLIALIGQGATPEEFAGIAAEAAQKGKGFAWVLAVLPARRAEAAALVLAPKAAAPQNHEAEKTQEWLRSRAMTPEEKAAADEARKRVMGSITVIGRQA